VTGTRWTIEENAAGERLDRYLADRERLGSRSRAFTAIERGKVFYVEGATRDVSALLHDRMTETVLRSFDEAAKLFEHVPPRPLRHARP